MNIFTKSLKEVLQRKNWRWLGGVPGIITVVSYIHTLENRERWYPFLIYGISIIGVAFLYYLFYFLRNAYEWIHNVTVESIWGDIVKDLAEVYARIHEIERKTVVAEQDIAEVLTFFCNKVKEIFDRKTNSNCCVSIKLPISHYSDSGEWKSIQVVNFSRDQAHVSERDTPEYKKANHDIVGNTAYSYIISLIIKNSSKPHLFLENQVLSNVNYLTSSLRKEIPYKSELVVPIIPSRHQNLKEMSFGGFLCIDSDKNNSFDNKYYDIPMVIGLADGLYSIMLRLLELKN